ncbi:MAG: hypothetical protein LBL90_03520 [Prevotellaceae bacterium]|nr:hypothetical protein [Prevotellaceae bacterium]
MSERKAQKGIKPSGKKKIQSILSKIEEGIAHDNILINEEVSCPIDSNP